MKVRSDFVTNSSSSSFVCFGVDIAQIKKNLGADNILEDIYNFYEIEESGDEGAEDEVLKSISKSLFCDRNCALTTGNYDNDCVGIGLVALAEKFPDRKLGDAKLIVAEELNKVFGTTFTEADIEYFEEAWYDG